MSGRHQPEMGADSAAALGELTFKEWMDFAEIPMPIRDEADWYDHVGRRIRILREQRGWSQLRLAVEMGRGYSAFVSYWESADKRPSAYDIARLEEVFAARVRP